MGYINKKNPIPYMVNRDKLQNWDAAKTNLKGGATQKYNVCGIGDSIDEGLLATDILNGSFLGLLRADCAAKYGDRGKGFLPSYYSGIRPVRGGLTH
jgi:hypothetical protein